MTDRSGPSFDENVAEIKAWFAERVAKGTLPQQQADRLLQLIFGMDTILPRLDWANVDVEPTFLSIKSNDYEISFEPGKADISVDIFDGTGAAHNITTPFMWFSLNNFAEACLQHIHVVGPKLPSLEDINKLVAIVEPEISEENPAGWRFSQTPAGGMCIEIPILLSPAHEQFWHPHARLQFGDPPLNTIMGVRSEIHSVRPLNLRGAEAHPSPDRHSVWVVFSWDTPDRVFGEGKSYEFTEKDDPDHFIIHLGEDYEDKLRALLMHGPQPETFADVEQLYGSLIAIYGDAAADYARQIAQTPPERVRPFDENRLSESLGCLNTFGTFLRIASALHEGHLGPASIARWSTLPRSKEGDPIVLLVGERCSVTLVSDLESGSKVALTGHNSCEFDADATNINAIVAAHRANVYHELATAPGGVCQLPEYERVHAIFTAAGLDQGEQNAAWHIELHGEQLALVLRGEHDRLTVRRTDDAATASADGAPVFVAMRGGEGEAETPCEGSWEATARDFLAAEADHQPT